LLKILRTVVSYNQFSAQGQRCIKSSVVKAEVLCMVSVNADNASGDYNYISTIDGIMSCKDVC